MARKNLDETGKPIVIEFPDADSGILLRGGPQINIWCWPVGSGELWSVRRNKSLSPQIRAAATPKLHADHNIGEWNTFDITLVGQQVNDSSQWAEGDRKCDRFPKSRSAARSALQHHGNWNGSRWTGPPSLIQFRNVYVKDL